MKALVQRVLSASVSVEGKVVGEIDKGLCVLLGIHRDDTHEDIDYIISRLLSTKLWPEEESSAPWKKCLLDLPRGQILVVSQFTLYAIIGRITYPVYNLEGRAPDFHLSMKSAEAKCMFDTFIERLKVALGRPEDVQTGQFQAYMNVSITNDGPVTIEIESQHYQKRNNGARAIDEIPA